MGNACTQCCENLLPSKPAAEEPAKGATPENVEEEQTGAEEQTEEEVRVAGKSKLKTLFADGNVLEFKSKASGKSLRIVNEEIDGLGEEEEEEAHFKIRVKKRGVVTMQNVEEPSMWLKIDNDKFTGDGNGDEFCEFNLQEDDGYIVFESVKYPGQYIGINMQGEPRVPSITGWKTHAHFIPTIKKPSVAGDTEAEAAFVSGNKLTLISLASKRSIRIVDGMVDGDGEEENEESQFIVHVRRKGVVALQNVKDPNTWLRIEGDCLDGSGEGDRLCEFKVNDLGGFITLESARYPRHFVGIKASGGADLPSGWTTNNTKLTPTAL